MNNENNKNNHINTMRDPNLENDAIVPISKSELEYYWTQKNNLLMKSIELNEQHLIFVKKRMEKLKLAIVFHAALFLICVVANVFLWNIKVAFWGDDQPTLIGIGLFSTGIIAFFDFIFSIKSIKQYTYHIAKDVGWNKPQAVDKQSKRKPARELNYKAEYEKVNWILRQYDNEKEQMYTIKVKIESGEMYDADDLQRQLHEVLIYEEVVPAMK